MMGMYGQSLKSLNVESMRMWAELDPVYMSVVLEKMSLIGCSVVRGGDSKCPEKPKVMF